MKRILSLCAGIVVAFLAMSTSSFAQDYCGNPGHRACCTGLGEYAGGTADRACITGASYAPGAPCTDPNGCNCLDGVTPAGAMCLQSTGCGGDGQRACCIGISEVASGTTDSLCQAGMVPTGICSSADPAHCVCGGTDANIGGGPGVISYASSSCVQITPCGGKGQRACCIGLSEYSDNLSQCNTGLTLVPGCSGDCNCGGLNIWVDAPPFYTASANQSCTDMAPLTEEPTTNATPTPDEHDTPTGTTPGTWTMPSQGTLLAGGECPATGVCGYADLHVHMFGNLAHGQAFIAGEPWDQNGVNAALAQDFGSSRPLVSSVNGAAQPNANDPGGIYPSCPLYLNCTNQVLFHADHGLLSNETGGGTNDGAASNMGVPLFNGWPLWTSTVHQQVYYKWLERAWLGGLRVMVMLAVSNEALCRNNIMLAGTNCASSMDAIDLQLNAAKSFQNWLDGQYGGPSNQGWTNGACQVADQNCFATQSGGPGPSWFQIVTSPHQAQQVIGQGKLAIVLGIEVDNIFNCHETDSSGNLIIDFWGRTEGPNCQVTPDANGYPQSPYLLSQLQYYYGQGVRHIFPVHDFDNAFGKTATWSDAINAGQFEGEGTWQDAVNCASDSGYGFQMNPGFDGVVFSIAFDGASLSGPKPSYSSFSPASCSNGTGTGGSAPITPPGTYLIQQAMNLGMIIDVDHMSIDGFGTTLNMATTPIPTTQPPPPYQYPVPYAGISASHVQFFDIYQQYYGTTGAGRHERMRTFNQLQQIASVGGMIGVMLKDDAQDTGNGWCLPQANCSFFGGHIGALGIPGADYTLNYTGNNAPNNHGGYLQQNCLYSTTETVEQYLYGVNAMTVQSPSVQPVPAVGVGSDFMGIAGHVGPRFGNGACGGNIDEQTIQGFAQNKLKYPFTLAGMTFDKQVSGQKTYDFNVDGLAHIGLFPDMIADMKQVGVYNVELQPLFSSAQAYVNMWAAVYKLFPPTVSMSGVPATAQFGTKFTVTTSNNGTTTSVPTITAGPSNVCSINGAVVTMNTGTGTCTVTAMWAADTNYAAATITQNVTGVLIPQVAIFLVPPPQSAQYGQSFQISAASKTLSVVPQLTLSGPCTNGGSSSGNTNQWPPYYQTTFTINISGVGTGVCTMTLTFPGDGVSFGSTTLIGTTTKTLIQLSVHLLGVPNSAPYNSSFKVSAQANGGPTSTIAVSGPCTISGISVSTTTATTSGTVTMTSATGTCSITANWPADDNFSSASVTLTTRATPAQPTVTFTGAPATGPFFSTFTVAANTNDANVAAVITASAGSACSVLDQFRNTPTQVLAGIEMTSGTGSCVLTATWVADSNYSGTSLNQTTAATKAPVTVTANNATMTFGQAIPTLTASLNGVFNNPVSVLSGSPSLTTHVTQFSAPGIYPITVALGTLESPDYSFTLKNGTLTVDATAAVPPSGTACNGAYKGGTFTGNITVTPNQICEIDHGVVNGSVTSTGGIVVLLGGSTVTGNLSIDGTATGSDANLPHRVCGATVKGNVTIQNDHNSITVGGTWCGATAVGGNLEVHSDSKPVTIASTTVSGDLTVLGDTSTDLLSGNTVGKNLTVEKNTYAAKSATQVINNHVSLDLVCSGNTSITGEGNTAKLKLGQCATF